MKKEIEILQKIEKLPNPKHLNPLPNWADPWIIQRLLNEGHLRASDTALDAQGAISAAIFLEISDSGYKILNNMGRDHTFMDKEFGRQSYNPHDRGEYQEGLVFVIMPFKGDEMDDVYSAIKDECSRIGLVAKRVDENTGSGMIIKEITDLIERAEFIICDLTKERPNVYYELGYAHGVGNEGSDILLIAKQGSEIHFDIGALRVREYRSTEELRRIVNVNLRKMIEETRN